MTREELSEQYFVNNQALHRAWRMLFVSRMPSVKDISPPQWWLLKALKEHTSLSGRALASHLHVSRSAVTQMLDGLTPYIVRTTDAKDRRIVHISLSKEGKARLEEFDTIMRDYALEGISALDNDELAAFVAAQTKMLAHFESHIVE
jgi:DNA-binding MarR family transcriptional regulator